MHRRLFRSLLLGTLALCAVLLGATALSPRARLWSDTHAYPLEFVGTYSLNGSTQRLPYAAQTHLAANTATAVTLYGHFNRTVEPNTQLVMRIPNLRVLLQVNGLEVFRYGEEHPAFLRTAGHAWVAFTSEGIQTTDEVSIWLENVYPDDNLSSFDGFFDSLATGSEYVVYRQAIAEEAGSLFVTALILLLGLVMLGVSLYAHAMHIARATDYVYLSLFVLASGLWTGVNYRYISLLVPYPALYQTLEMLCMALLPVFLIRYLLALVAPPYRSAARFALYATLLAAAFGAVLQLAGAVDLPMLTGAFVLMDTAAIALLSLCLLQSLHRDNKAETHEGIKPLFILFTGALLNFANFLFHWHTEGLFFALSFLAFALVELLRLIRTLRENVRHNHEYMRLENELTQSRIAVMLSQIKPHFLFNALNAISALCLTDPIMADQAITSLSNYLRGNIRSLEQSEPVPFARELDHIKYYVRLEQLRYGDKLHVVYAIDTQDFSVPTLSLQTLVENAIRHGVSPKPEGGLVVVHTERGEGCTVVRIMDNGVGFDPDMRSKSADSIGLANAKKRMEVMMGATFEVCSIPGKGTTVTIRIPDPKKEATHENPLRG